MRNFCEKQKNGFFTCLDFYKIIAYLTFRYESEEQKLKLN